MFRAAGSVATGNVMEDFWARHRHDPALFLRHLAVGFVRSLCEPHHSDKYDNLADWRETKARALQDNRPMAGPTTDDGEVALGSELLVACNWVCTYVIAHGGYPDAGSITRHPLAAAAMKYWEIYEDRPLLLLRHLAVGLARCLLVDLEGAALARAAQRFDRERLVGGNPAGCNDDGQRLFGHELKDELQDICNYLAASMGSYPEVDETYKTLFCCDEMWRVWNTRNMHGNLARGFYLLGPGAPEEKEVYYPRCPFCGMSLPVGAEALRTTQLTTGYYRTLHLADLGDLPDTLKTLDPL